MQTKWKFILRPLALAAAFALAGGMLAGCNKNSSDGTNDTLLEGEESAPPAEYIIEADSAQAALEAYLLCLKDEQSDAATYYVWPVAETAAGGDATAQFLNNFSGLGYGNMQEYEVSSIGETDSYSLFNVHLTFETDHLADDSEFVVNGDMPYDSDEEDESEDVDEPVESTPVEETPIPLEESAPDDADSDADIPVEEYTDTSTASPDEIAAEEAETEEATPEPTPEPIEGFGREAVLMTVVQVDGKYLVSPNNFLANYTNEEMRLMSEILTATANEAGWDEEDIAKALQSVHGRVISAQRYATSMVVDIRIENLSDDTLTLGSEENPPIVAANGIVVQVDPLASRYVAEQYGLQTLRDDDGALESDFSTFTAPIRIAPGETAVLKDIQFEGNYEWIYAFRLPSLLDSEGNEIDCQIDSSTMTPDNGSLSVRNPFLPLDIPEEDFESTGEDYDLEGNLVPVSEFPTVEEGETE